MKAKMFAPTLFSSSSSPQLSTFYLLICYLGTGCFCRLLPKCALDKICGTSENNVSLCWLTILHNRKSVADFDVKGQFWYYFANLCLFLAFPEVHCIKNNLNRRIKKNWACFLRWSGCDGICLAFVQCNWLRFLLLLRRLRLRESALSSSLPSQWTHGWLCSFSIPTVMPICLFSCEKMGLLCILWKACTIPQCTVGSDIYIRLYCPTITNSGYIFKFYASMCAFNLFSCYCKTKRTQNDKIN